MAYEEPKSDDKTLYIQTSYGSESLGDLINRAMDHFGLNEQEVKDQITVRGESIKVRGCMCHSDWGDYEHYLILEK